MLWTSVDGILSTTSPGRRITIQLNSVPHFHPGMTNVQEVWEFSQVAVGECSQYYMTASTGAIWSITREMGDPAMYGAMTDTELELYNTVRLAYETDILNTDDALQSPFPLHSFRPADTCVFLRPLSSADVSDFVCVFIGSLHALACGQHAERILWLRRPSGICEPDVDGNEWTLAAQSRVMATPKACDDSTAPHVPRTEPVPTPLSGSLANGERYVIYRCALYYDGFKKHISLTDSRAVAGIYMLPLNLSVKNKSLVSSVRIVSLVPPGIDPNVGVTMILDDIVVAATKGIMGQDPHGAAVRIFIDPVCFFGDYVAMAEFMDHRGHNAIACCTVCTFRLLRDAPQGEYMYTTDITSGRLGSLRSDRRLQEIRLSGPTSAMCMELGIREKDATAAAAFPSVQLGMRLREKRSAMPYTSTGRRVNYPAFDSHLSSIVAPDHLLTGLAKNVLTLCLRMVTAAGRRRKLERQIIDSANRNGLPVHGSVLTVDKSTKTLSIGSVTMSSTYVVLLFAAPLFSAEECSACPTLFRLPALLQRLVARVYSTPQRPDGTKLSGETELRAWHSSYLREMRSLSQEYINQAAAVHKRLGATIAGVLDKPNCHRLLELCGHTIPSFGHTRNCSEMILEQMHQTMKRWLSDNRNPDAHLTAVDNCLARDWASRFRSTYDIWRTGNPTQRICAERGLWRLVLGPEGLTIDANNPGHTILRNKFRAGLLSTIRPPIDTMMKECGVFMLPAHRNFSWECSKPVAVDKLSADMQAGLLVLRAQQVEATPFAKASYVTIEPHTRIRRAYPHQCLRHNCAIQTTIVLGDNCADVLRPSSADNSSVHCFSIQGFAQEADGTSWAIVKMLLNCGDGSMDCLSSRIQVVQLTSSVQRVAIQHVCDAACSFGDRTTHSTEITAGGKYRVMRPQDGYPPRLG